MKHKLIILLKFVFIAVLTICVRPINTASAETPLKILIDDYPPFEFQENGKPKGIGSEVVKAALAAAGMQAEYELYPFARAYNTLKDNREPVFYYSLVRTPQREKLFQWVAVVVPSSFGLFAYKNPSVDIRSMNDLKKYNIGTVIEDVVDQHLRGQQQKYGFALDRTSSYESNARKLFNRRIDLLGGNRYSLMFFAEKYGHDKDSIHSVYTLNEIRGDLYLVASRCVPEATVRKIRAGFETIEKNGVHRQIIQSYFENK